MFSVLFSDAGVGLTARAEPRYLDKKELYPLARHCAGVSEAEINSLTQSKERLSLEEVTKLFGDLGLTEDDLGRIAASLQYQESTSNTQSILTLPRIFVYTMEGKNKQDSKCRQFFGKGDLSAVRVTTASGKEQVLLTSGDFFCYALRKGIPTVRMARLFYLLPFSENKYFGVVVSAGNSDSTLEILDAILAQNSDFHSYYGSAPVVAEVKQPELVQGSVVGPSGGGAAVAATGVAAISPSAGKKPSRFAQMRAAAAALKAKAKAAVQKATESDTFKKAKAMADKKMKQVQESKTFQKVSAKVKEGVAAVKSSDTYQNASSKVKEGVAAVRSSNAVQKASDMAKKGVAAAKDIAKDGVAYAKQVYKSQQGKSVGDKVATGVGVATDAAVKGIGLTAKFAAGTVRQTVKILKKTLKPAPKPKTVSETTKRYVKTAASWSGKGVTVTKHMASTALAVADALSGKLTQAIEQSTVFKKNKEKLDSKAAQDAKKIVKAGIEGSFKIVDAMVEAGLMFVAEVTLATGEIAEHTQGGEVGAVAKAAGAVVTNAAKAGANLRFVGVAPLAKRAMLGTTIEMLGTEEEKKQAAEGKESNATASLAVNLIAAQAKSM